jgi:ubiquinone/menaquinone biosynthesis C-methylase UbiE
MDEIKNFNKSRWEALAKANVSFSRPWSQLDRRSARDVLDPLGLLGNVKGKNVLCLAAGGGQQSVAFALLEAYVTVFDFSETQLERDQSAAADAGIQIKTVLGDMRDLSVFEPQHFDIVWQPPSINYVAECSKVIEEVSRVLKKGGFYHLEFANPLTIAIDERSWDGQAYPLKQQYIDGEEVIFDNPEWEIWDSDGSCQMIKAPKQYRHTLSTIINSTIKCGLEILRFWEEVGSDSQPGSWGHFTSIAPATLGFWSRSIRQSKA